MNRKSASLRIASLGAAAALLAGAAQAAPVVYRIDPSHTYPSFEADHMGISLWRGKFNRNSGSVTLDKAAGTGSVDITIDATSIDFGHDGMNEHANAPDYFDTAKYPTATYTGKLVDFVDGKPTRVDGTLTLRDVSKPVELKILSFKCIQHPRHKREVCGADALGTLQRDAFGIEAGKAWGFDMTVTLRIQVEALAEAEGEAAATTATKAE
jgi:polyisoprenoid-binding protein YceI